MWRLWRSWLPVALVASVVLLGCSGGAADQGGAGGPLQEPGAAREGDAAAQGGGSSGSPGGSDQQPSGGSDQQPSGGGGGSQPSGGGGGTPASSGNQGNGGGTPGSSGNQGTGGGAPASSGNQGTGGGAVPAPINIPEFQQIDFANVDQIREQIDAAIRDGCRPQGEQCIPTEVVPRGDKHPTCFGGTDPDTGIGSGGAVLDPETVEGVRDLRWFEFQCRTAVRPGG